MSGRDQHDTLSCAWRVGNSAQDLTPARIRCHHRKASGFASRSGTHVSRPGEETGDRA
jgi:hypothetical protein